MYWNYKQQPQSTMHLVVKTAANDAQAVAALKQLQNRRWNARKKYWEVHLSQLAEVMKIFGLQPRDCCQVLLSVHREPTDGRRTGEHRLRLVGEPDAPDRLRRTAQARGKRQLPCSKVMPVDQIRIPDPGPEQQLLSNPPGRFEITVLHERLRQGLLGNYQS